jgi:hypothetical protein
VRSSPELVEARPKAGPKAGGPGAEAGKAVVVYRQAEGKLDEADLLSMTGFLAEVFERSALRVAVVRGGGVDAAGTKRVVESAGERFDILPGRLFVAKKAVAKAAGSIEVLAAQ